MSRPSRTNQNPAGTGAGADRGERSAGSTPGPVVPPELVREAKRAAADLLVFAPIGLAKRARTLLPDLIREGRSTAASARTIGKFVTPIARKQGTKLVKAKVAELTRPTTGTRSTGKSSAPGAAQARPAGAAKAKTVAARKSAREPKGSTPSAEPFAGYDHLGSAAVVARLGELSRAERTAVGAYEKVNRNRRTILGRIEQLDPPR